MNYYDLIREFPVITLQCTALKSVVGRLLWIRQEKSNNIRDLNNHVWGSQADEDGNIGKAYGYQLGVKHHYKEEDLNQVDRTLYDLERNPLSRRIMSNIYSHHDLCEVNLYPCAYSTTSSISGNILSGILSQRSQNMLIANSWDVCQYAILLHVLAQTSGLKPGKLVRVITDAHIYGRHIPVVEELLKWEPYPGPTLSMGTSTRNFYQFITDSFRLEHYQYHTFSGKISVAIQAGNKKRRVDRRSGHPSSPTPICLSPAQVTPYFS